MNSQLFWLKNWLFFCVSLLLVCIFFKIFEQVSGIMWIKEIKKKHFLIKRSNKFRKKYLNKITYQKMKEIINDVDFRSLAERPAWFELFDAEKIVFFEIPWGEVYCECSKDEYKELIENIDDKFKRFCLSTPNLSEESRSQK